MMNVSRDCTATVEEFIQMESDKRGTDLTIGHLRLRDNLLRGMNSSATNKKSDTLMRVIENMAQTRSNVSFLVELQQTMGVVT
ncbi:hypothetical protein L484_018569 [Morus notabilis]|uniref:Uncharacterized protein n=1 Tax=Morus notabilis TaxID=981085 RepID=W9QRT9_9ROSA|nr:hypothetical protein L484_018569 [Morus notabilis]